MSKNESVNGQAVDDVLLCGMTNLKCSESVDQKAAEISPGENVTWSNSILTFSTPISVSRFESFSADTGTDNLKKQEKSVYNLSPILFNSFNSTDLSSGTLSITGPSFFSTPKAELSACGLKSKIPLPIPSVSPASSKDKDCENVQPIANHESLHSNLNQQMSIRGSFSKEKDPLESTDILQEAIQILNSLSFDISRSLDSIPKSIALPSVIEKYSRRTIEKSFTQDNPSSVQNANKVGDISTVISPCEEILQLMAAMQCRCLEYREAALDIAESIVKECLTDVSICVLKDLIIRYDGLRDDFNNFRKLCFREKRSRTAGGAESLSSMITDCLQTSYLRLLVEENETFLVRLKFGIYMVRMNARLMRDLKEASIREEKLEEEVDYITRTTIGYRV